jgi:hypothetical protein
MPKPSKPVKAVLRKRGVKPKHLEALTKQAIPQAEAMFSNWPIAPAPHAPVLKGLHHSAQRWTAGGKGAAVLRWENVRE